MLRARVKNVLVDHKAKQKKTSLPKFSPPPRLANYLVAKALQHTLRVGLQVDGVASFAYDRSVWLALQGQRYWVDAAALPADAIRQGQRRRMAVVAADGSRQLVTSYTKKRKLHLVTDQGAFGWSAGTALYSHFGVWGTLEPP